MARLIDTSLRVDFTRPKSPPALKAFIMPWLQDAQARLCEPVAFEVLRHATPAERSQLEAWFSTFPLLPLRARFGGTLRDSVSAAVLRASTTARSISS